MIEIYNGTVIHHRHAPKEHKFTYPIQFYRIDLLQPLPNKITPWIHFRQKDYLSTLTGSLSERLEKLLKKPIDQYKHCYLYSQVSCLGLCFNPISFILCEDHTQLNTVILEVHNTPWNERHHYMLPVHDVTPPYYEFLFTKKLHVSPFMEMNHEYFLKIKQTKDEFQANLKNLQNGNKKFEASIRLSRNEKSKPWLFMPQKTVWRIYWQALKIWLKGVPFCPHPKG